MLQGKANKRLVKGVGLDGEKFSTDLGLRAMKVSQKTLNRYLACVRGFETWARENRKKADAKNLDKTVSAYLGFLFQDGAEYSEASYIWCMDYNW